MMFAPEAALDRYKTIPNASQSDPSTIGRLEMWETALYIAKDHPFFGVGMRNFVQDRIPNFIFFVQFDQISRYRNLFLGIVAFAKGNLRSIELE